MDELNWDDLRIMLAVGRHGSVSGAARVLGVDQTTVGRRISALESRLGTILFVRSRQGFTLTDAGAVMMANVEAMESHVSRAAGEISAMNVDATGFVRIVTTPWIISTVLIPALPDFRSLYRNVEVRFIGDPRGRSLVRREAEIALWFEVEPQENEISFEVGDVPYALFAPVGADPDQLDWVSFWDDLAVRDPMRWLHKTRRDGDRRVMTANDSLAVHQAIRTGIGKGLIPIWLGRDDPLVTQVSEPAGRPDLMRKLNGHCHPDLMDSLRIRSVITWLRTALASRAARA